MATASPLLDNALSLLQGPRIALVMVGLPATGKTFTARNLSRYLRWLGVRTKTFSVAAYRRRLLNGLCPTADFFDPTNEEALGKRTAISEAALKDLIVWLGNGATTGGGQVGILDASNTTSSRRALIEERLRASDVECIFVECLYSQIDNISRHVEELMMSCPEYGLIPAEKAAQDFLQRIDFYRPDYRTLTECPPPVTSGYIQLVNGGEEMVVERVHGYLPSRVVYYLMNLRDRGQRSIFLMPLNEVSDGRHQLATTVQCIRALRKKGDQNCIHIWTPTSDHFIGDSTGDDSDKFQQIPRLNALEPGNPATPSTSDFNSGVDPYFARNPQGESYHDLVTRLEPVIMDLEGMVCDVLILADISVVRCIHGYFCEMEKKDIVAFQVSEGTLIELKPKAYGCYESHYRIISESGLELTFADHLRLYKDNIASP